MEGADGVGFAEVVGGAMGCIQLRGEGRMSGVAVSGVRREPMLAHMVYFTLKDRSAEAIEALVASCHKYLSGHPGTVLFAAGVLTPDLAREVNDRDFDVALQLVFENRAAHSEENCQGNGPNFERQAFSGKGGAVTRRAFKLSAL
jgi:hypothetical protein